MFLTLNIHFILYFFLIYIIIELICLLVIINKKQNKPYKPKIDQNKLIKRHIMEQKLYMYNIIKNIRKRHDTIEDKRRVKKGNILLIQSEI